MAPAKPKYRKKFSLLDEPDMSSQQRTPIQDHAAHVQTLMPNSQDRNCGNTSAGNSITDSYLKFLFFKQLNMST